jgi:alanyl-tRNA synthetase
LRKIIGKHVEQKGSFVGPDYLRFDFSHFQKLTEEELIAVEKLANQLVRQNLSLNEHRAIAMEEALGMGALAFFGEKYGEKVRVIKFGDSVELCGGTHVTATGQIGMIKIVSESAIAAGIRRIEAITALKAEEYYKNLETDFRQLRLMVKNPVEPLKAVQQLIEQNAVMKKQMEISSHEKAQLMKEKFVAGLEEVNGVRFLATRADVDSGTARDIAYAMKASVDNLFLVIGSVTDGKAALTVMLSDMLVTERGLHAGNIVRQLAQFIGGGGGGQPTFATAGGKNPEGIDEALKNARKFIS